MKLPLASVLRSGVVFFWPGYTNLDDPAYEGRSKAKFAMILRVHPATAPIVYLLTSSEKAKHASSRFRQYLLTIPAGTYDFLPLDTVRDVSSAGTKQIGYDEFKALYECGAVVYKGSLSAVHVAELTKMVVDCPLVSRAFKQTLQPRS
jgi:hypothetical protein